MESIAWFKVFVPIWIFGAHLVWGLIELIGLSRCRQTRSMLSMAQSEFHSERLCPKMESVSLPRFTWSPALGLPTERM